jgi:Gas vesicle synthesis protein GvpL/GvpF
VLLVHGVLHDRDRASVERLGAGPVRARPIVTGALAAVVSAAPEQGLTPDDAVAHLELLVALVTAVPVLPLPLGTTAPDDDAVREEVLAPAAEQLERLLAAVADLVELRLDLAFDTDATVADIARGDPAIERLVARSRAPGAGLAERMALGEAIAGRVADVQTELAESGRPNWPASPSAPSSWPPTSRSAARPTWSGATGSPTRTPPWCACTRQPPAGPASSTSGRCRSTASSTTSRRTRSPPRARDGGGERQESRRNGGRRDHGDEAEPELREGGVQ